jgi:CBS domain-containing protein
MILKELFRESTNVVTLTPDDRISDAADLMRRENVGSVVIVDDQQIVGIITDRDLALSLGLGAATPDSFVAESMTKGVATINESMSLLDATRFFRNVRVKRLPVVDDKNRLVGIVSTDDVLAILARELVDTCSTFEPNLGYFV